MITWHGDELNKRLGGVFQLDQVSTEKRGSVGHVMTS